jgi:hypothetical protein
MKWKLLLSRMIDIKRICESKNWGVSDVSIHVCVSLLLYDYNNLISAPNRSSSYSGHVTVDELRRILADPIQTLTIIMSRKAKNSKVPISLG